MQLNGGAVRFCKTEHSTTACAIPTCRDDDLLAKIDGFRRLSRMIVHPWVESRGQLFVVRFPAKPTCDEIEGFGAATHTFYENNQRPFSWVVDATAVAIQGALQRKTLAEVLEKDRAFLKRYCKGMAIIVPNALLRGAGQAILWLAPPGYAYRFFAAERSAFDWAEARLSTDTESVAAS